MDPTISARSEGSSAVVIAVVEAIGESRWTSEDGKAPVINNGVPSSGHYIYQELTLRVENVAKGSISARANVLQIGGQVGCYSFGGDLPAVESDARYVFFLAPTVSPDGLIDEARLTVGDAWPIVDDVVQTPLQGKLALTQLARLVAVAPADPFGY